MKIATNELSITTFEIRKTINGIIMHAQDAYTMQLQDGYQMNRNCFDNIGSTDKAKTSQNEF